MTIDDSTPSPCHRSRSGSVPELEWAVEQSLPGASGSAPGPRRAILDCIEICDLCTEVARPHYGVLLELGDEYPVRRGYRAPWGAWTVPLQAVFDSLVLVTSKDCAVRLGWIDHPLQVWVARSNGLQLHISAHCVWSQTPGVARYPGPSTSTLTSVSEG